MILASLAACSSESFTSTVDSLGQRLNKSQRDSVIRNSQRRISDDERCSEFKERLLVEGQRYDSSANAAFHAELMKVKRAAQVAGCLRDQEQHRSRAVIYKSGDAEQALLSGEDQKEAAWNAYFQPSDECLKTVSVECGNDYIRARSEFERKYANGEL